LGHSNYKFYYKIFLIADEDFKMLSLHL
jgi:hypothetical protein